MACPRGPAGSGGFARRADALLCAPPMGGPARPTPGVPVVSRRKEPKACRGCAPGPPEGGTLSPLRRCRTPQIGLSATTKDRFATLSGWANRSFFLPKLHRGSHSLFSIRGSAGMAPRMPRAFLPSTNTARTEGRGNPRGSSPLCRRSRDQEVPGESLPTFFSATCQVKCNSKLEKISEGEFQLRHLRGR